MPGANPAHAHSAPATSPEGSADAFEALFTRYFDRLRAYCRRIGGQEDAEDLAQEALIRAWANLERFDTARHMWPWLKAIASNLAIDRARRRARETALEPLHDEALVDGTEPRVEERLLLSEAMAGLTPSQQTALRLRYLEDWDTADVASFLGLSVPALKQLAYRARDRLRAEYRRLTDGALGWILVPARVIRRLIRAPASRVQRTAGRVGSHAGLVGEGPYQLAAGVLGLALVVGGWATPLSSGRAERSSARPISMEKAPAASMPASNLPDRREQLQKDSDPPVPLPAVAPMAEPKEHNGRRKLDDATNDIVGFVTDPNEETEEPEDARIQSVVFSPGFASDRTVFAAGIADCRRQLCESVLFRSIDGGSSWIKEPAAGMTASTLFLPPGYGRTDERIFGMGPQGLQVSDDGGQTFQTAFLASAPQAAGSAAMSPAFNDDDPSILIGAETLIRYRDDRKTLEPYPGTAPRGPFEPSFSPAYPSDRTILLGGTRLNPVTGTITATVFRCIDGVCIPADLQGDGFRPTIRFAPDFASTGTVYAFSQKGIFLSRDRGESFSPLPLGWSGELVRDLAIDPLGRLLATTGPVSPGGPGGLYESSDGGLSWTEMESSLFAHGAASLAVSGDRILVGLAEGGVACSSDAGLTWSARCLPAT